MAKLRIGHIGLNQHLFRFQLVDSPLCECGEVETRENLLMHCIQYQN